MKTRAIVILSILLGVLIVSTGVAAQQPTMYPKQTATPTATVVPTSEAVELPTGIPVTLLRTVNRNPLACMATGDPGFPDAVILNCSTGIGAIPAVEGYMFQGQCYKTDDELTLSIHPFNPNSSEIPVFTATDGKSVYVKFMDYSSSTNSVMSTAWTRLGAVAVCPEATAEATVEPS